MFSGSIVALITPMYSNGSIDYDCLKQLIDWHIAEDTDAFVLAGSTGEAASLTDDERQTLLQTAVEHVHGRKPVIAGTGTNSLSKTIELTDSAKKLGVDGCLIVTPYYVRPPQEGLYQYFSKISDAVDIPIILYNVPSRTGCDLLPETVGRLQRHANIVGIKEATGKLERVQALQSLCGNKMTYLSGDDPSCLEFMRLGGHGVISITSNIAPKLMHEMCASARQECGQAHAINQRLAELHELMCIESNPIPVKWSLNQMKRIPDGIRLPLVPLSEIYRERLAFALKSAHLL